MKDSITQVITDKEALDAIEDFLWNEVKQMEKQIISLQEHIKRKKFLISRIIVDGIYEISYELNIK